MKARKVTGVRVAAGVATTAAALAVLATAAPMANAQPASVMTRDWRPQMSVSSSGPADNWTARRGSSVTMTCWTTGPSQLGTGKWFHINMNSYPYRDGFVPANAVGNQSRVGHC